MIIPQLHSSVEISLEPGDILFHEGDLVDCGYIIASGELILYKDHDGQRVHYERRGSGSIIGELSILTSKPRGVTVEAVTTCQIYKISAEQILHRYDKIDTVLRACVDTSIGLMGRFNKENKTTRENAPLIPSTLHDPEDLIDQIKFECEIFNGLENNEFYLDFQPIVGLEDGEMVGVEALMRWHHPNMGNVSPGRFIPVAEKMGAICKLTDIALMEGCAALSRFQALHQCCDDFFVTINISNQDIGRPEFFDFLVHVLDLNDLEPKNIKLEVTETALVLNSKPVIETLEKLRGLGLGIAIDDFGTGYSNLSYLKEIPLTALKIDRAFAGDAASNRISHSIVKMIINLGHELGVRVVAEGLETPEDVQTLRDLGCDLAQGYYFAKPMSEADLADMIQPNTDTRRIVA